MRFKNLIAPVVLLALLSTNCDEELDNEINVNQSTMALVDENQLEKADEKAVDPVDDETLRRTLQLAWVGFGGSETAGLTELTLKVKNNLPVDVKAKANIFCDGFLGRKGSRPLTPNAINLAPAEEGLFTIHAKKLPLQNLEGATSFQVLVDAKIKDPNFGEVDKVQATSELFYRHSQDYETIKVFTEQILMEKYDGVITEKVEQQTIAERSARQPRIIGRILDANDKAIELMEEDLVKKVIDEEGVDHGVASGLWVEVLKDTDDAEEDQNANN